MMICKRCLVKISPGDGVTACIPGTDANGNLRSDHVWEDVPDEPQPAPPPPPQQNRHLCRFIDGSLINPWDPSGPVPPPEVYAHALARLCRYGGHVRRDDGIYSVGEHLVWCAVAVLPAEDDFERERIAHEVTTLGYAKRVLLSPSARGFNKALDYAPLRTVRHAFLNLTHDLPEGGGLVDVPGPVTSQEEMRPYRLAHKRHLDWIYRGWGITGSWASWVHELEGQVKETDTAILGPEMAIRPHRATIERTGMNEHINPWPWLDLSDGGRNAMGIKKTQETWASLFHILRARIV